jgi:hypothetical protein
LSIVHITDFVPSAHSQKHGCGQLQRKFIALYDFITGPRVFTAFKVYKPATALNVTPIGPRLLPKKNSLVLSRSGYVSLDIGLYQNPEL